MKYFKTLFSKWFRTDPALIIPPSNEPITLSSEFGRAAYAIRHPKKDESAEESIAILTGYGCKPKEPSKVFKILEMKLVGHNTYRITTESDYYGVVTQNVMVMPDGAL